MSLNSKLKRFLNYLLNRPTQPLQAANSIEIEQIVQIEQYFNNCFKCFLTYTLSSGVLGKRKT